VLYCSEFCNAENIVFIHQKQRRGRTGTSKKHKATKLTERLYGSQLGRQPCFRHRKQQQPAVPEQEVEMGKGKEEGG